MAAQTYTMDDVNKARSKGVDHLPDCRHIEDFDYETRDTGPTIITLIACCLVVFSVTCFVVILQ